MVAKFIDLTGKKFGKLTVISQFKKKMPDMQRRWNCLCDCGGEKIVKANSLIKGKTKSCGCLSNRTRLGSLVGKKFGRLTVVSLAENINNNYDYSKYWNCICDCGKEKITRTTYLIRGLAKSCGCLITECAHLNEFKKPKMSSERSAASLVWKARNRYVDIPFDDFFELMQQNCYYCGAEPDLVKHSVRKDSVAWKHGTLDRVDSSLGHTIDNVVPCCLICNRAKLTRTVEEFKNYLNQLKNNKIIPFDNYRSQINLIDLNSLDRKQKVCVNILYVAYKKRNFVSLTVQEFASLIQQNCYYCGEKPSNKQKYNDCELPYSSLDRIDSSLGYSYDNVVPSCKYCNSAKNNLSYNDFLKWIDRFKIKNS